MKVIIGSDHAGWNLKQLMKDKLGRRGCQFEDVGTNSGESCNYVDFAVMVAQKVQQTKELGILICGTGNGMCIVANKFKGIRAVVCLNEEMAKYARKHNDANILCLGARILNVDEAIEVAYTFLKTNGPDEERHIGRVKAISEVEKNNFK
jgi:ribose 5-phosphate isomerase B